MTKPEPTYEEHRLLKVLAPIDLDKMVLSAFVGAKYHFRKIEELTKHPCMQTKWKEDDTLGQDTKNELQSKQGEFHWHVRGFFWEMVSTFDLMLMWCNYKYNLGIQDHMVGWKKMPDPKGNQQDWKETHTILKEVWESAWYFEVNKYRNYGHRSFLFIQCVYSRRHDGAKSTLEQIYLVPSRQGQQEFFPLLDQLQSYLNKMQDVGFRLFSQKKQQ